MKTKIRKLIEGLQLIEQVEPKPTVAAEHDEFYAGNPTAMTAEQQAKMEELGWHVDDTFESWAIFV